MGLDLILFDSFAQVVEGIGMNIVQRAALVENFAKHILADISARGRHINDIHNHQPGEKRAVYDRRNFLDLSVHQPLAGLEHWEERFRRLRLGGRRWWRR